MSDGAAPTPALAGWVSMAQVNPDLPLRPDQFGRAAFFCVAAGGLPEGPTSASQLTLSDCSNAVARTAAASGQGFGLARANSGARVTPHMSLRGEGRLAMAAAAVAVVSRFNDSCYQTQPGRAARSVSE